MRVYEVAKKFKKETSEILQKLKEIGIEKKNHLAKLEEAEIKKIDEIYNKKEVRNNGVLVAKVIKRTDRDKEVIKEKVVFNSKKNTGGFKSRDNKNGNSKFDKKTDKPKRDFKQNKNTSQNDNKNSKFSKDYKNNFNKDKDDYSKDNKFQSNNFKGKKNIKKDTKAEPAIVDTPSFGKGNKKKSKNKKYEYNKESKFEKKELRTDFRKDDSKKRKTKKKDKPLKDEIIRVDGDNSLGMITIKDEISIKELSEKLGLMPSTIISKLFMEGKILNINAILSFEEAEEIALGYDVIVEKEEIEDVSYGEKYNLEIEDKDEDLSYRAPIITIMGHVDHGKTSLLDALRHTNVIDTEAGGITQSIGAYQVKLHDKMITFIDTPGHEAFTEMRVRGTNLTDIAVLVVAADDGVKPQTIEAISHAKEAKVPIIVAINKIDKAGANPMKVRQELTEHGLVSTEWGGDTDFVEISAKQKLNLESLLETILLTAELLELKANHKKRAKAIVIESRLDTNLGPVADILVQEGELKKNDIFVVGETYGKIRKMTDYLGKETLKAYPSQPVEIIGFSSVPVAGDILYCVNNEKQAKKIVEDYKNNKRENELNKKKHISLESLSKELEDKQLKELKCIIRTDTMGSNEALKDALLKLSNDEVSLTIVQSNTGAITEGDIKLAEASNAIIIGFNVRPTTAAQNEADRANVEIRTYDIIYKVIEDMEQAMKGMLEPTFKEIYLGRMEVKQVFKISNVGNIAGSIVIDGKITKTAKIRLIRDGIIVHTGDISTIKRYKDDVKEATLGQECGISIKDYTDIKQGDIIESFYLEEVKR